MFSHYGSLLPLTQGFFQSVCCTGSSKASQDLGCPTNVLTMTIIVFKVEKWMIKEHNSLRFINMSKGIQRFQKTQELKAGFWSFWKRLHQANTKSTVLTSNNCRTLKKMMTWLTVMFQFLSVSLGVYIFYTGGKKSSNHFQTFNVEVLHIIPLNHPAFDPPERNGFIHFPADHRQVMR